MAKHYGMWSAETENWYIAASSEMLIHSSDLGVMLATCRQTNHYWKKSFLEDNTSWQVKIIGDDGLPVDLPKD